MKDNLFVIMSLEKRSFLKKDKKHLLRHTTDSLNRSLLANGRWRFLPVRCSTSSLRFSSFLRLDFCKGFRRMNQLFRSVKVIGSAYAGGMQKGDLVKEVDGKPISTWTEFAEIIQESPGIPLAI